MDQVQDMMIEECIQVLYHGGPQCCNLVLVSKMGKKIIEKKSFQITGVDSDFGKENAPLHT